MKAKSPKAKVWEVLSKNEKPFETPNHKYHSHTCTVTRKIVPIFVDDDIKIIEREKIINMHNVFMKETNNEYTEKHMNNLFNMLFENKKHYKAKRNNFTKTSHEFLPFLKSKSPKTTTNKQIHTDNNNVDTKEFEPYDSEIEENIKNDIYNRNKIVIKLRKQFPFFKSKKVKENSKATVEPIIKLNKQVCSFTLNNYQRNIENLKRYRKTYENLSNSNKMFSDTSIKNKRNRDINKSSIGNKGQMSMKLKEKPKLTLNTEEQINRFVKKFIQSNRKRNQSVKIIQ